MNFKYAFPIAMLFGIFSTSVADEREKIAMALADRRGSVTSERASSGVMIRSIQFGHSDLSDAEMQLVVQINGIENLAICNTNVTDKGLSELRKCLGLKRLDISNTKVSDNGLSVLQDCKLIQNIDLSDTSITDRGLWALCKCKSIQVLRLRGTTVTDAGLWALVGCDSLRSLDLSDTRVSVAGLELIARLPNLEELIVSGAVFEDAKPNVLASCKRLRRLAIVGCSSSAGSRICVNKNLAELDYFGVITQEVLEAIGGLTKLKKLHFRSADGLIGKEGSKQLAKLRDLRDLNLAGLQIENFEFLKCLVRLQVLDLSSSGVADESLANLTNLVDLEELTLSCFDDRRRIGDQGMRHLCKLRGLKTLNLVNADVSDDGMREIANLKSLMSVDLSGTRVTDNGMKWIGGLTAIESLRLRSTRITNKGLSHIVNLKTLTVLDISSTNVNNGTLEDLVNFPRISQLFLDDLIILDEGAVQIGLLPNLTLLHMKRSTISHAGLMSIAKCGKLERVDVTGTDLQRTILDGFANAMPLTRVLSD
jgi:Leucine-rich repeat (LRR) protein